MTAIDDDKVEKLAVAMVVGDMVVARASYFIIEVCVGEATKR